MNRNLNVRLRAVSFQTGVDIVGQPIFTTHIVSNTGNKHGKQLFSVKQIDHRL